MYNNPFQIFPGNNYNFMQQPQQSQNAFCYVNGPEGAKAFIVAPNSTALLMDSDKPVFYLKTANAMGQATLKAYSYTEVSSNPQPAPDYVSRAEFEAFKKEITK